MPQSFDIDDALDHFSQDPWCAELLDAAGILPVLPSCRTRFGGGNSSGSAARSHDQLFSKTLNTDEAVPWILAIIQDPLTAPSLTRPLFKPLSPTQDPSTGIRLLIPFATLLVDINEGVMGLTGFVHGGFIASLLDESIILLFVANYRYQRKMDRLMINERVGSQPTTHSKGQSRARAKNQQQSSSSSSSSSKKGSDQDDGKSGKKNDDKKARKATAQPQHLWPVPPGVYDIHPKTAIFTASINVRFEKPIAMPNILAATASINRIEGRKLFVDGVVRDSTGVQYAKCDAICVATSRDAKM